FKFHKMANQQVNPQQIPQMTAPPPPHGHLHVPPNLQVPPTLTSQQDMNQFNPVQGHEFLSGTARKLEAPCFSVTLFDGDNGWD
ncbi:6137_t:CDS:1, partial [Acaulospora colombiana]